MKEIAEVITALAALISALGALGALALGVLNYRTINTVKQQTDGMLSTMKDSAHKEGKADAIAEGKA